MNAHSTQAMAQLCAQPETAEALTPGEWDLLIRQGRRANLLGKLACVLERQLGTSAIPAFVSPHLRAAATVASQQQNAIRWEVLCIQQALEETGVPAILLKGAAYVMAGLPVAAGRVFSDVDILVPHKEIERVESALLSHGWTATHHDAYTQRYYRQWMHEIPPLVHERRGTVIDVHHAIVPTSARLKVNVSALWDDVLPVPGYRNVFVLSPVDMVIHSATHLFLEGELHNGLRDLFDIDRMLRDFGEQDDFWRALLPRARLLGLERPVYYALHYARMCLNTPVPLDLNACQNRPSGLVGQVMDSCYSRVLCPLHDSCTDRWTPLAKFALYVRSHWMRMPFTLLVYHLGRKALTREEHGDEPTGNDRNAV